MEGEEQPAAHCFFRSLNSSRKMQSTKARFVSYACAVTEPRLTILAFSGRRRTVPFPQGSLVTIRSVFLCPPDPTR